MDLQSMQGAFQTNAARPELPPSPPQESDVQEFQKLYWNEAQDPSMDPVLQMALSAEIDPVKPSDFSRVMEKMMENSTKVDDMKDSIFERLKSGGVVSAEERMEFMMKFREELLHTTLLQGFTKKTEEGLKTLLTGQ